MKILLTGDHESVRCSVKQVLADEFGAVASDEAASTTTVLERIKIERWELLVFDKARKVHCVIPPLDELARRGVRP